MERIPCRGCGVAIEESLLCPHCGAAQVPQIETRAGLQRALDRERAHWPRRVRAGLLLGLLVGAAVLGLLRGLTSLTDPLDGVELALFWALAGCLGAIAWTIVGLLAERRRRAPPR
jgi:hypothetical protein